MKHIYIIMGFDIFLSYFCVSPDTLLSKVLLCIMSIYIYELQLPVLVCQLSRETDEHEKHGLD